MNDEYYKGKSDAVKWLDAVVQDAAASVDVQVSSRVTSVGSDQNPYYKIRLPARVILALVETDFRRAQEERARAIAADKAAAATDPKVAKPPTDPVRYLVIRRIWSDHSLSVLIDRSVSTVKADAARRAFLAEGRDIVWAVIDSGIDSTHVHFSHLGTLDVTLPVRHYDFTISKDADDQNKGATAVVDEFGHGTHVAGIIAGEVRREQRSQVVALRTPTRRRVSRSRPSTNRSPRSAGWRRMQAGEHESARRRGHRRGQQHHRRHRPTSSTINGHGRNLRSTA